MFFDFRWSSVMFQTVFSGLLQCEKVSEVLRMSLQELQRFRLVLWSKKSKREPSQCQQVQAQHVMVRWSKRGSACGQSCEEDIGSVSMVSPQEAWSKTTSRQSHCRYDKSIYIKYLWGGFLQVFTGTRENSSRWSCLSQLPSWTNSKSSLRVATRR